MLGLINILPNQLLLLGLFNEWVHEIQVYSMSV